MKLLLIASLCTLAQPAFAEWRMIGTPRYGLPYLPPPPRPLSAQEPQPQPAPTYDRPSGPYSWAWRENFSRACKDPYRTSGGKSYDLTPVFDWLKSNSPTAQPLPEWGFIVGKIISVAPDGLLVDRCKPNASMESTDEVIFIKNDPFENSAVDGKMFVTLARMDGRHQYTSVLGAGKTVRAFDHGTRAGGEELARFKQNAAEEKRRAAEETQRKEDAKRDSRDQQHLEQLMKFDAQDAKTVEFQKLRAAAGSATAQFDLGCRYFEGVGVPKDVELARQWLTRSAEQGNAQAKAKLTEL